MAVPTKQVPRLGSDEAKTTQAFGPWPGEASSFSRQFAASSRMLRGAAVLGGTLLLGVPACGETERDRQGLDSSGGNAGSGGNGGDVAVSTSGVASSTSAGVAGNTSTTGSVVGSTSTSGGVVGSTSTTGFPIGPACPLGSSPGCCFGDGGCCSCVAKVCDEWALASDPGVPELTACVCQVEVCGDACVSACAGQGIDATCLPCVQDAVSGVCAAAFETCIADPPASCSSLGTRLIGVCLGTGAADGGSAGATGVFEDCGEGVCEVNLSGEVVEQGTGTPADCDQVLLPLDDLEGAEIEWFQLQSGAALVTVGLGTPAGAPALEIGDQLELSLVQTATGASLSLERDDELVAHVTRGQLPASVTGLELSQGVALCDEIYATCRSSDRRLDATFEGSSLSLTPGETRSLGPLAITLERYTDLIAPDPDPSCEPSELRFAVVRTEP